MRIELVGPDDWRTYRDVRLRALQADPGAFASTHERESSFDDDEWIRRTRGGPDGRPSAIYLAVDGERAVGTAAVVYPVDMDVPMLVGMWVAPDVRGRGVGRKLVDAVVAWVAERGDRRLVLWVVDDNHSAIALYESCGFEQTGEVAEMPGNPCSGELEMTLELGG